MTEAEKKKREKYDREAAILAHSIAAQVAAAEDITYSGAFHILDHAKAILENEMKRQRAKAKRQGTNANPPAEAGGCTKIRGITIDLTN